MSDLKKFAKDDPSESFSLPYTAVHDFVGLNGLGRSGNELGFRPVGAFDLDKHSADCYKLNHSDEPFFRYDRFEKTGLDMLNAIGMSEGELDLFTAGCPCPPYSPENSNSHLKLMTDERIKLLLNMARDINFIKPRIALLENVSSLLLHPAWTKLQILLDRLVDYRWDKKVLCCAHYGAPTMRYRLFIILVRRDVSDKRITFPEPTTYGSAEMTIKKVAPHIQYVFGGRKHKPEKMKNSSGVMPTITATRNIKVLDHLGVKRWMTTSEILRFSSFPPDMKFAPNAHGKMSDLLNWRRVGNAVPPATAYEVIKHVRDTYLA
jgi:site-specific DNA-cytosine methylase